MPIEAGAAPRPAPTLPVASNPSAAGVLPLYLATVLIWGTTWIAVKWQVGSVAPEVSLLWRFLLAAPLMLLAARLAGLPLAFPAALHRRFLVLGALMFSLNFILFYHAAQHVVSGLLGVIFSAAAIVNVALARLTLGTPVGARAVLGALVGIVGVALLFLRESLVAGHGAGALVGLGLGMAGTISFCLGNMISARLSRDGVPVASAAAWGMIYGAAATLLIVLFLGRPFAIDASPETGPRYLLSLLYLAGPGSVVVFWLYLTLLGRIGPGPAAYTTVVSPVLALLVSTAFEGYRWTPLAFVGLVLVAVGNVLVLTGRRG